MEPNVAAPSTAEEVVSEVARWVTEIKLYEKEAQQFEERGKKILKRYKDERSVREFGDGSKRYNILYSNVQTLLPAYFSRSPKPDIERRFKDKDDVGRIAADVWERCTSYFVNTDQFKSAVQKAVFDRLLPGRGVVWERYIPHMRDIQITGNAEVQDEGAQTTDDVESEPGQEVYYEETCSDYVYWEDFGHTIARTWEEVRAVWRKVYLTRDELKKRFGDEIAALVPLDYTPRGLSDEKIADDLKKATIYELWDKITKKAKWLHKDVAQLLDDRDDPLGLDEFFPCPRPLTPTLTNDTMFPIADYTQYQDQAKELDDLTGRIGAITKALKVAGVYDASAAGVERVLSEGVENKLIPVEQWAVFGKEGGLKGVMDFLPMKEIMDTLLGLYEAREAVKRDLYEITGLADIIRGASNANETATAQKIKGNFATLRLDDGQQEVQRFARDLVRIKAQIIANHFSLDTIKAISGVKLMTQVEKQQFQMQMQQQQMQMQQQAQQAAMMAQQQGQQPPPPPQMPPIPEETQELLENPTWEEVYALLKDNAMRCFRIDIETDSTIKADQQEEKQSRIEFLTAVGGFLAQAREAAAAQPELTPLLMEMLMFGIRGFSVGKTLETTFEITRKKLEKAADNPQPKQDPEMAKVQGEMQMKQQQMQADQQAAQVKVQSDTQSAQAKMQADSQIALTKANNDAALQKQKLDAEIQLKREIEMLKVAIQAMSAKKKAETESSVAQQQVTQESQDAEATLEPIMELLKSLTEAFSAPKQITLDNGRTAVAKPMIN